MKKLITGILAIALIAAMSTTAFASENSSTITSASSGSQEIDVKAKYVDQSTTVDTYRVDVSWGAMEFTYTLAGDLTWNTETHQFDDNTAATWSETGNEVTVTNHSNLAVNITMDFTAETVYSTVTGSFTNSSFSLESAVGKTFENADSKTVALELGGTLAENTTTLTKVGAITVTVV